MDLRESSRSCIKRDGEDSTDLKGDRVGEDEGWNGNDKRKHRSNRSRKQSNVDEAEELDNSGRRRSSGDRIESRKRSGGSSRVESGDENEYDARKDLRSKLIKKSQEDKIEKKLSSSYQETEIEGNRKGRDISGSKGHGITDDSEKESSRKSGSKPPIYESSQSRSRSKVNSSHDGQEKVKDRDSRYAEKKESSREKSHGSRETDNNTKKRGDDSDLARKGEESNYVDKSESRSGKVPDSKHGSARDIVSEIRSEPIENKSKVGETSSDKAMKSSNNRNNEEKRIDEKIRSRGRPDNHEEDNRPGSINREEKSGAPRDDKLRTVREKQSGFVEDAESIHKSSARGQSEKIDTHGDRPDVAHGVHDSGDTRERTLNIDEDGRGRTRDRSGRELRPSKRSWSPERVERRHPQSGGYESDNERSVSLKGKERERESYRDDWSRGRDSSWNDRNKDRDGSKDSWKRRHDNNSDKDTSYVDLDHGINWDSQRRDRERNDNEKSRNHPGYRKIGRNEGGKPSLSYGGGNRSSDMIEIRPTSIDYGEGSELLFTGKKTEGGAQKDYTSATGEDQWGYLPEDNTKMTDNYGPNDDVQQRYPDDGSSAVDQNSGRNNMDAQGERGRGQRGIVVANRSGGGPSPRGLSQSPFGNSQGSGNFSRLTPQGAKGNRLGRGGRGRITGRDGQRVGIPMPMMGSPFGPLGMPPGPMQTLGPNMSPGPGPPMVLGGFIPQFPGPNAWPGARGLDMNMLSVQHGLSPVPPVPSQPRFPLNVVTGPNPAMYFNQQGPVRGVSPSIPGPGYNAMGTIGRGLPNDKALAIWNAPRTSGPPGKAPSRGEQNDYSQNFVDTGMRPQNYIRELELTNTVEDYPKLRELIQRKDEIVAKSTTPPMYYKCDLREFVLSPEFFGTKFDVILVDPPWEEYVHRAPGSADHMEYWTFEEISNLKIEAIADTPSFIFLWVGDGVGLEQGRQCLRKWGFRRCEDICWVKTNKSNSTSGLRHDSHTLFQHSKEHCLMGIKGTVRRSTDGHIIHANIDTDIVIAEESPYGSTAKPEDMYRIIEHFALGRRRLELFGEDHNIRPGWLTLGKGLSSSDFNAEAYIKNFCDKDGKVWQGGGGRNPPPGAPHLVVTTPEIEGLRPKSPPHKNQQQQNSITLTQAAANPTNRRPVVNSPQNPNVLEINPEASSSNVTMPAPWGSPAVSTKPADTIAVVSEDKIFDNFGHDPLGGQANVDLVNFGSHGATNVL